MNWRTGVGLLAVGVSFAAWGQGKSSLKIEVPTVLDWTAPIAGEDGRTVMLVRGAKATPSLGSGQVEVTKFRLETYRYTPEQVRVTELVVESPLGRFGPQGAGSGDPLTLKSADGRFAIAGTGWSWSRSTGLLVVSNAVETSVRRGVGETNRPPVQIRSRRFEYNLKSGDARYLGDCVAEDPGHARVSAGELRSRLSPTQTQPDSIQGAQGVVIDLLRGEKSGQARGESAIYTAATAAAGERIELNGKPSWQFGPSQGSADQLILLPAQDAYTARGHAQLKLQGPDRSQDGRDLRREAIEIACEVIEANSTNVVFQGPLTARQGDRLQLKASHLSAVLGTDPKTHETSVMSAKATGDVTATVGRGEQAIELRGQAMNYAWGDPSTIDVEGEPAWKGLQHSGTARRFRIEPETESFEALETVRVRWSFGTKGAQASAAPVDIASESMRVDGSQAAFRGGVKATGGRWEMSAADVDLGLGTNRTVRGIAARQNVRFLYEMLPVKPATNAYSRTMFRAFGDGKAGELRRWEIKAQELTAEIGEAGEAIERLEATGGVTVEHPAMKARGGHLTYAAADRLLRLSDDAALRSVDGLDIVGVHSTVLTMDPQALRFGVEGPVKRWRMPAGALRERASTNAPVKP